MFAPGMAAHAIGHHEQVAPVAAVLDLGLG